MRTKLLAVPLGAITSWCSHHDYEKALVQTRKPKHS